MHLSTPEKNSVNKTIIIVNIPILVRLAQVCLEPLVDEKGNQE